VTAPGKQALIEWVRANVPRRLRNEPVWLLHDEAKILMYANGDNRPGVRPRCDCCKEPLTQIGAIGFVQIGAIGFVVLGLRKAL
jgi:hypothetical protein